MTSIRPARPEDSPVLQSLERSAQEQFALVGYDNVAADPPGTVEVLTGYADAGRSWVAEDDTGAVIGYLLVDVVDGAAHIEQVTVHPDHQRHGVGRALVAQASTWARDCGRRVVTLTTFSDVPWNRPLYAHLGFRVLDVTEIGPELRAVREEEAAKGFGPEGRVAMGLDLDGRDGGGAARDRDGAPPGSRR